MTQQDAILKLFLEGRKLDPKTAQNLTGSMRLSGVVKNLEKKFDFVFDREDVKHKTRYKTKGFHTIYWLDRNKTNSDLIEAWEDKLGVRRTFLSGMMRAWREAWS